MKYRFLFTQRARRQLRSIDPATAMRILHGLATLGDDPYRTGVDVKKLAGSAERYRLRVGDYRIVYRIDDGQLVIEIIAVAHRRDVYRGDR